MLLWIKKKKARRAVVSSYRARIINTRNNLALEHVVSLTLSNNPFLAKEMASVVDLVVVILVRFAYVGLLCSILLSAHFNMVLNFPTGTQPTLLYSFVHLTDTQTLSERYPETLNSVFLYMEQVRIEYNIKRIFVTGDLVENFRQTVEWRNFLNAKSLTSVEVDCLAGNHDNDSGRNSAYYDRYIGADKQFYFSVLDDFLILLVSWPRQLSDSSNMLNQTTAAYFNNILDSYPSKIPVFATHYFSDGKGFNYRLTALGQQLLNLARIPVLVLMGHVHESWAYTRNFRGRTIYEFNTNYQGANTSYVRIFSIYSDSTIQVREIRVEPRPVTITSQFIIAYSLNSTSSEINATSQVTSAESVQAAISQHSLYAITAIVAILVIIGLFAVKK